MVNQVGSPAMLEGNRFLPLTGMPIWNRARSRTALAVWLPEPLTVATWMLKSLTLDSTLLLMYLEPRDVSPRCRPDGGRGPGSRGRCVATTGGGCQRTRPDSQR